MFEIQSNQRPTQSTQNPAPSTQKPMQPTQANPQSVERRPLRVLTVDVPSFNQYARTDPFGKFHVMYEVFAKVVSITEKANSSEKYILLRSVDTKPVVRAYYYTHEPLNFRTDDIVRCIGTVTPNNQRFQAISIRAIDYEEYQHCIKRLEVVTNFSIANMIK